MPRRHGNHTAFVVRIVAPRYAASTDRRSIEVGRFKRIFRISNVDDAKARGRVGLVHQIAFDVQIMVRFGRFGYIFASQDRVVQVRQVPDEGPCALNQVAGFVKFVIDIEIALIVRKPSLMRVGYVGVGGNGHGNRIFLIRHVRNGDGRFVRSDTDFAALVVGVGAAVDHALRVMRIARATASGFAIGETTGKDRIRGVAQVDHVQATATRRAARAAADRVPEARLLVDHDVVRTENALIQTVSLKLYGRIGDIAQAGQVKDLHAVLACAVRHDVGVVLVDLHVPPNRHIGRLRHTKRTQNPGLGGIAYIHERCRIGHTNDGVLPAGFGVFPTPEIIGPDTAVGTKVIHGHEGEDIDTLARKVARLAVGAFNHVAGHRVVPERLVDQGSCPIGAIVDETGTCAVVQSGSTDDERGTCRGQRTPELAARLQGRSRKRSGGTRRHAYAHILSQRKGENSAGSIAAA